MYSGIKEKINNYKNLKDEEKEELKKVCKLHHDSIRLYMEENDFPYAVRNALEDRMVELSSIILK